MPLNPTIIGDIADNGLWGGLKDYIGDSTSIGQGINTAGNLWQKINGSPQSQLIGVPQAQATPPLQTQQPPSQQDAVRMHMNSQAGATAQPQAQPQFQLPVQPMIQPTIGQQPQDSQQMQPQKPGFLNGLNAVNNIEQAGGIGNLISAIF